ncbi:hypothetical protein KUTeg_007226 [Tegillarca granosa]|uniref:Arginine kinase n=1 Tax=Tegillarca granosa TaxID=220873 RepID=A0ABQ9FEL0_TEGGR|nr:hypothetical protein KUTeg_007226 [Tegillarca granosa]
MYRGYCEQLQNTDKDTKMSKGGAKGEGKKPEEYTVEELFKKLDEGESHSLLKKYLTKDLFLELKDKKTKLGGTLKDCIISGCLNLNSHCGVYACDPDGYTVFDKLLDPVIKDYHNVKEISHPPTNFGDLKNLGFGNLDPSGEMIISTRVRVGRSHANFKFCPSVTEKAMNEMQTSGLEFARLDKYGFLTFCPTNLGTAMRASVHIKIPKLSKQPDFKDFCNKLQLQPRGIHGENTESVGGVYDISNKRRLGLTEFEAITEMKDGIMKIMEREKEL